MGVDGTGDVGHGGAELKGQRTFGDEVGGVRSGEMRAEELAARLVGHELEHAGQFAHGLRLAQFAERKFRGGHLKAPGLCLRFGQAHVADFRRGEDAGRHDVVIGRFVRAEDVGHRHMRFGAGHVRQHDARRAENVADGVYAGHRGFKLVVHRDVAALVRGDAGFGKAETFAVGHTTDGHEQAVGFQGDRLPGGGGHQFGRKEG